MLKKTIQVLACLLLASCASPAPDSKQPTPPAREPAAGMNNPNTTIQVGDTLRMEVSVPGRKNAVLETVQKNGDVATPDGSFIRAGGVSLGQFRLDLLHLYGNIPGYEQVQVSAYVDSSPYKVVRYNLNRSAPAAEDAKKKPRSWDKDFWADFNEKTKPAPKPAVAPETKPNPNAATLYPRNFSAPMTIWEAIQKEGGLPDGVEPSKIHVLRRNLNRLTFDCSGPDGSPDGRRLVESGDVIFLVPPDAPLHGIFE